VIAAVLLSEGAAVAGDPAAAEALFRAGRNALKRGDWDTACASFAKSQELDPAAGTALNLATCEERDGRLASAWQRLREALDLLPAGDDRLPLARQRLAELEPRVPHLTVRLAPGTPADARVLRDDVEVSGALLGFPQPIDPGRHVVVVVARGFEDRAYPIESTAGQSAELVVAAGARRATRLGEPRSNRRTLGFVAGGVGVSAVALGIVTGLTVIQRAEERRSLCPCLTMVALANAHSIDANGNLLSAISTTAFVVGAVGLATGAYLVLTSPEDGGATLTLAPSATGSGGGASALLAGSF
jgi:hypothetical protein